MNLPPSFPYVRTFVMTGRHAAGVSRGLMADLNDAIVASGFQSDLVMVEDGPGFFQRAILDGRPFFTIDGNQKIKLPAGIKKFSWMVDHPCSRMQDLADGNPDDIVLGWVDESHLAVASAFNLPFRSHFLPHAGSRTSPSPIPMADRDIDLLFSGGLAEPLERDTWLAAHPGVAPVIADVIFQTVELLDHSVPVLPLFVSVAAQHGIDVGKQIKVEVLCTTISSILTISEMNRRCLLLASMPDTMQIAVASGHLPTPLKDRPNIRHLGFIDDFLEIRRLMANSRIVLNCTNKFPEGGHERVFYGMAEGAVVLTDPSTYLEKDFHHGREIFYLPKSNDIEEMCREMGSLVKDPKRLTEISEASRPIYEKKHTWSSRIEDLFRFIG